MSIDAGAQVTIILFACGPCVVILNCSGHVLYLGRAPRTKETLPYFREWCWVTWHPRVDGLSTDTPVLGRHNIVQPNHWNWCILMYAAQCVFKPEVGMIILSLLQMTTQDMVLFT